jgi:hypothetical protein
MAARHDVVSLVHAVVKSSHSVNVVNMMDGNFLHVDDMSFDSDMLLGGGLFALFLLNIYLVHGGLNQCNTG